MHCTPFQTFFVYGRL